MATTANSYIADKGQITLTINAAGATATGLTAGTYTADIVVRKWEPTAQPERARAQVNVTGGTINVTGAVKGAFEYTLTFIDDYAKGGTGELGSTPNFLTVTEILYEHFINEIALGELTFTPAGAGAANIEWTIDAPEVVFCSLPGIDADSTLPNERTARISWNKDDMTEAAHG